MLDSLHSLQHHQRRCSCRRQDMCLLSVQAHGREEPVAVLVADGWKWHWEMCLCDVAELSQVLLELDV